MARMSGTPPHAARPVGRFPRPTTDRGRTSEVSCGAALLSRAALAAGRSASTHTNRCRCSCMGRLHVVASTGHTSASSTAAMPAMVALVRGLPKMRFAYVAHVRGVISAPAPPPTSSAPSSSDTLSTAAVSSCQPGRFDATAVSTNTVTAVRLKRCCSTGGLGRTKSSTSHTPELCSICARPTTLAAVSERILARAPINKGAAAAPSRVLPRGRPRRAGMQRRQRAVRVAPTGVTWCACNTPGFPQERRQRVGGGAHATAGPCRSVHGSAHRRRRAAAASPRAPTNAAAHAHSSKQASMRVGGGSAPRSPAAHACACSPCAAAPRAGGGPARGPPPAAPRARRTARRRRPTSAPWPRLTRGTAGCPARTGSPPARPPPRPPCRWPSRSATACTSPRAAGTLRTAAARPRAPRSRLHAARTPGLTDPTGSSGRTFEHF